jgi:hypothetical protein
VSRTRTDRACAIEFAARKACKPRRPPTRLDGVPVRVPGNGLSRRDGPRLWQARCIGSRAEGGGPLVCR